MGKFLTEVAAGAFVGAIAWLVLYVIIGVTLWVSFVVFGAIALVGLVIAIGHLASARTGAAHSGSRGPIGAH